MKYTRGRMEFGFNELLRHNGEKMIIGGKPCVLKVWHGIEELSAPDWHTAWECKGGHRVWTGLEPYGKKGVYVQVDDDSLYADADPYYGKVRDFEHYKRIVKEKAEKMMGRR
jgi:hypothetical protein